MPPKDLDFGALEKARIHTSVRATDYSMAFDFGGIKCYVDRECHRRFNENLTSGRYRIIAESRTLRSIKDGPILRDLSKGSMFVNCAGGSCMRSGYDNYTRIYTRGALPIILDMPLAFSLGVVSCERRKTSNHFFARRNPGRR
jgi:hypothetical protein|eukprot:1566655-Prymnesium_polylepis.2